MVRRVASVCLVCALIVELCVAGLFVVVCVWLRARACGSWCFACVCFD